MALSITAAEIAAAAITAAKVGTNEIVATAANIKDAVITGAKIASLAVDTLQIANQAVTIPTSSANTALYTTSGGTCLSCTFTSTGNPVAITFCCTSYSPFAGMDNIAEEDCLIQLKRGSTIILAAKTVGKEFDVNIYNTLAGTYIDTPGSGSVTYNLVMTKAGTTSGVLNRSLVCLEVKK